MDVRRTSGHSRIAEGGSKGGDPEGWEPLPPVRPYHNSLRTIFRKILLAVPAVKAAFDRFDRSVD